LVLDHQRLERLPSPQPQQLAQQLRLVLDPQWLKRLPSSQPQQLAPDHQYLEQQRRLVLDGSRFSH
jgi:hypothetical protein